MMATTRRAMAGIIVALVMGMLGSAGGYDAVAAPSQSAAGQPTTVAGWQARNAALSDDARLKNRLADEQTPMTWLFVGDSITQGVMWTGGLKRYSDYFEDYLRTDALGGHNRSRDVVVNAGVSSATTEWLRQDLTGWVANRRADVVFLAFGVNDGREKAVSVDQFKNNLLIAIKTVRAGGGIPVLMTENYTMNSSYNGNLSGYIEAIRSLAVNNDVLLVDFAQYWLDSNHGYPVNAAWMGNEIHPNAIGHLKFAQFIMNSLSLASATTRLETASVAQVTPAGSAVKVPTASLVSGSSALARLRSLYKNSAPAVWSFVGGATTQGTLAELSAKNWVQLFDEGLRWEHESATGSRELRMKFVQNVGLNGLSSAGLVQRYQSEVAGQHPAVLFITPDILFKNRLVETNVATFRANMMALIGQAQAAGTVVVLVTPPQLGSQVSSYAATIRSIAASNKQVVVIDASAWISRVVAANPTGRVQAEWFDSSGFMTAKGQLELAKFIMGQIGLNSTLDPSMQRISKLNYDSATGVSASSAVAPEYEGVSSDTNLATGVRGDQTGDGRADVIAVDGSGATWLFQSGAKSLGSRGRDFAGMTYIAQVGDLNGDKRSDVIARDSTGKLFVFESQGQGYFGVAREIGHGWNGMDQMLPVSNLGGGSTQYLVARRKSDGSLWRYEFTSTGLLNGVRIGVRWGAMRTFIGVGDKYADGRADVLAIDQRGRLWAYSGRADGTIGEGQQIGQGWGSFTAAFSPGDVDGDGRWDLFGVRSDGTLWEYRNNRNGKFGTAVKAGSGFGGYKLFA